MLFSVTNDTGSRIEAYSIPDHYSGQSNLSLFSGGELLTTVEPNVHNPHAMERHETGQVGFAIDESMVPGLAAIDDLEIRDADTGVLIYRRTSAPVSPHAFFRLETQMFPLWRIDQALKPHFRFWWDRIDKYSAETATQILHYYPFGSTYASGRLLYRNYEYCIYSRQKSAIMMQEPFEEMAERLLLFKRLGSDVNRLLNERDAMIFAPILEVAQSLDSFDEAELRRVLGKADVKTLNLLSNPVARQLTAASPSDPAPADAVSKSLKLLSEFDVVGTRDYAHLFTEAIAELLDVNPMELPRLDRTPKLRKIAASLRAVGWIDALIEADLELYHHIQAALKATI